VWPVLFAWLPGTRSAFAQTTLIGWASVAVIAISGLKPATLCLKEPGLWLAGLWLMGLAWAIGSPLALNWLLPASLMLIAGWRLTERCGWLALRHAVVIAAWAQIPLMALQAAGWDFYPGTGSVGLRGTASILLGMASLWSSGRYAWVLAIAACATGSWTGFLIPMLRLLPVDWKAPNSWVILALFIGLTFGIWGERLLLRWDVWASLPALRNAISGWGLWQLPAGFQETITVNGKETIILVRDLHNTWLEWIYRGGIIGTGFMIAGLRWLWMRAKETRTLTVLMFVLWVGLWQSMASQPVIALLFLIWALSLCKPERVNVDMA
jgi:hypothetical protein